ncbi:hypothetical protein APSETT444_010695 [Aspergillus pseudonomiae]
MADYDSALDGLVFNEALIRARVENMLHMPVFAGTEDRKYMAEVVRGHTKLPGALPNRNITVFGVLTDAYQWDFVRLHKMEG